MKTANDWCFLRRGPDGLGYRHGKPMAVGGLKVYPALTPLRATTDPEDIRDDVEFLLPDFVLGDGNYSFVFRERYHGVPARPDATKMLREYAAVCEQIFMEHTTSKSCPIQWIDVVHEMPDVDEPEGKVFLGHSFYRHARIDASFDGDEDSQEDVEYIGVWSVREDWDKEDSALPMMGFVPCEPDSLYAVPLCIMMAATWDTRKMSLDPDSKLVLASDMLVNQAAFDLAEKAIGYIGDNGGIAQKMARCHARYQMDLFGDREAETADRTKRIIKSRGLREAIEYYRKNPMQFTEEITQNVGNQ